MNTPSAQAWLLYPTWLGYSETLELPLPVEAYEVVEDGDQWVLRTLDGGVESYRGIGPIKVVDEPLPF